MRLITVFAILVGSGAVSRGVDLAGNVAAAVLRGDLSQAKAIVEGDSGAASSPTVAGLRRSLQIVQQLDSRILSSFNVDQGQLLNVELTSGSEIVQIRHVEGTSVRVVRRVGTDEASEWTLTLDQLAPAEKLRRVGQGSGSEVNLLRGLVAWSGRDRMGALEYFRAAAPDPLALAIVDSLSQGSKQKAEASAREDLVRLLQLAGLPPATALDKKTASTIRRQTFPERNLARIRSAATAFRSGHAGTDTLKMAEVVVVELERVDTVAREIDVGMIDARLSNLKEANPGGDLKSGRKVTQTGAELSLAGNPGLTNITAIGGLPFVRIDLSGSGVSDISPLKRMPLQDLNLSGCPIADISPLRGAPLQALDLSGTLVRDLAPIEAAPIQHLALADCSGIVDLAVLLKLEHLRTLILPSRTADPAVLRRHPAIKSIGYRADALMPVAEFWEGRRDSAPRQ